MSVNNIPYGTLRDIANELKSIRIILENLSRIEVSEEQVTSKFTEVGNSIVEAFKGGFIKQNSKLEASEECEPTWEQVKEYCRKRCLTIVTADMFAKITNDVPLVVSDDCISREWLKKWMFTEWDGNQLTAFKMTDFAPSVAPKAKEGEWVESPYEDADGMTMYRCSECGCLCEGGYNYCFMCGAKMRDDNVETD